MNKTTTYQNKRSPEDQQASDYLVATFGKDWPTNKRFYQAERRFNTLLHEFEEEVIEIIKEKMSQHANNAPFLLVLSPLVYHCILTEKKAFKTLEIKIMQNEIKMENMTNDEIFQKHIKEGNRYAKRCVLNDPIAFDHKTVDLAHNCREPITYKFKRQEMINNII